MRKNDCQRKTRFLNVETLEKRELMASDVSVNISQGTLFINGSKGNDNVRVIVANGVTNVLSNNRLIHSTRVSYSAIDARMNDGLDRLEISAPQLNNLNSVRVDFGNGSAEQALIKVGNARNVHIDANRSISSKVILEANADRVFADFGNDGGRDVMEIKYSSINRLETNMGGGNDTIGLARTSIRDARVNLGTGLDALFVDEKSAISSGIIDGGTDNDEIRGRNRLGSHVSVRNFERVR